MLNSKSLEASIWILMKTFCKGSLAIYFTFWGHPNLNLSISIATLSSNLDSESMLSSDESQSVRLQPSLQSNPASSNLWLHSLLLFLLNSSCSSCWGPYNQPAQLFLFPDLRSKNFFNKIFTIFTKESKSIFTNRKWIYPNRKWNYFSHFQTSDQKSILTKQEMELFLLLLDLESKNFFFYKISTIFY